MTNTDERIKRLCQLCLQDHYGYLSAERPEVLAILHKELEEELVQVEGELVKLDVEYRLLVKGDDTTRRMEVANRKLYLSRRSEDITYELTEEERTKIVARRRYGQTKELQNSLAEQRQIINSIWGPK